MLSKDSDLMERAFKILNEVYFENCLPEVVITIQSKPRAYGYITTVPVWKENDTYFYEINITAEYLYRPIVNVMATLQHEMCHLYAMVKGIKDTSQNGRYHNKRFKQIAEARDLLISHAEGIGYSVTEPSPKFIETIKKYGLDKDINHYRGLFVESIIGKGGSDGDNGGSGLPGIDGTQKKKTSTRKYICKSCGISVRATKDVWIICGNCKKDMEKVEADKGWYINKIKVTSKESLKSNREKVN